MTAKNTPGKRIEELCKTYNISRETLSERSGVPMEMIRRVIDEDHIPDLAPLIKISHALGVRLGTLVDDHEELGPVITRAGTAGEGARFITGLPDAGTGSHHEQQGLTFSALAPHKGGRHMEPFIVDIAPEVEQLKTAHEGEEFIYVLFGNLAVDYGSSFDVLHEGDTVYYDSIVPHRVYSNDNKPVRILAVIYTPV